MNCDYCPKLIVNHLLQITVSGNTISNISDHYSQFCIIKSGKDKQKVKQTQLRDFSKFSEENVLTKLSRENWDQCFT